LLAAHLDGNLFSAREFEMIVALILNKSRRGNPVLIGIVLTLALATFAAFCAAQVSGTASDGKPAQSSVADGNGQPARAPDSPGKSKRDSAIADAAELVSIADQLRDELKKTDVHVLPFKAIEKTQSMEKLAKKIKGESGAR
jgi:hypothetical protein